MSAKLILLSGVLSVGGYVGYKATSYDPAVVSYSKAEVQQLLASAKTTLPRRDGDGHINIWGAGSNGDGVKMAMKYDEADWAPVIPCQAVVTELGPKQSRVVADCGAAPGNSAIAKTERSLRAPMFDEFIQSKLQHREFDRSRASSKEMGAVMQNMGAMQKEALKTSDEMSRMTAQDRSSSQSSNGWGTSGDK